MLGYLVLSTLVACGFVLSSGVTAPIADLGYARYQGFFDAQTNITSFLAIRYAAPPIGNLRFQAPQAPDPESGIQLATQNPNECYQAPPGSNDSALVTPHGHGKRQSTTPASSEDCLFLNVFVPGTIHAKPAPSTGLPVLVWIHGGGYHAGSAAANNGADLVADSLNTVITVVIQYRLGAFGFLSGKEVKVQGALNAGLLDQTFALQWVQEHIGLFGGDKNHVTIWGISAGAGSVLQHIVANGGDTRPPLFNAAITSSTFLPSQYKYDDQIPQVVAMTGCSSQDDTFECLQSVDVKALQTANYDLASSAFYGTFVFVPVVDGAFIVERPTVTLSKGQVNGQVLLAVTNKQEGNAFVNPNETLTIADYISRLFPDMTSPQIQDAASIYAEYGNPVEQAMLVMGDAIFVCPTYYLLESFTCRSWKGLFAVPPALHGYDFPYYFYSPSSPPPYNNTEFITAFSQSFMSLAKYYDVNMKFDPSNITPYWAEYNANATEMLFNRTEAGAPVIAPIQTDASLLRRCTFWSSVTSETAQ